MCISLFCKFHCHCKDKCKNTYAQRHSLKCYLLKKNRKIEISINKELDHLCYIHFMDYYVLFMKIKTEFTYQHQNVFTLYSSVKKYIINECKI